MKGQFNKPIYAIMTSLVLILGTFALAFPPQEANAGISGLVVELTITCKENRNNPAINANAAADFIGENKAFLGFVEIVSCAGDGDMESAVGRIPTGTKEVIIFVACNGAGDSDNPDSEKKFREGQASFKDKLTCKVEGGSAQAVLTSKFTP